MKRHLLWTLLLLSSSPALAEEYLILVQTVGYQDVPVSEKVPEQQVFNSLEVLARPNEKFHSRARTGPETLTLEGKLQTDADGSFSMQIRFCREVDTGNRVPRFDGSLEPVLDVNSTECEVTISLDRAVSLGGSETQADSRTADRISHVKSQWQHVLTVTRRKPE